VKINQCIAAMLVVALVPAFSVSHGAQIDVPADFPAIQSAINAAANGDTIIVSPGRYVENIDFLGKAITVQSIEPLDEEVVESTVIDGGASGPCVKFINKEGSDSVISGFTITNGYASGDFWPDHSGGGIECWNSSPTISYNVIKVNSAAYDGGGIYCSNGAAAVISNQIAGNSAGRRGGGVFVAAALMRDAPQSIVMNNCILQNSADMGGGLYCMYNGTIQGNEVILNSANGHAGGMLLKDMEQGGSVRQNTISFNSADCAGGIELRWVWPDLFADNTISCNTAVREGGGILCAYFSGIYNCIIEGNVSGLGGAIDGTFNAHFNTVVGNRPVGLNCEGGWLLEGNLIHDNGIGINVERKNVMIVGNTISGNSTGICNHDGDGSTMACNTIAGNRLGIQIDDATNVVMTDTIVTSSLTTNIRLRGQAELTIQSSLVEGGAGDIATDDTSHLTWGPGNIDADPLFVDPGHWDDAGTPDDTSDDTFTLGDYHLLPGSPCMDAGTNDVDNRDTPEIETLPATDIAGLPRVIDGNLDGTATVDMGAYEYLPGDVNYDGKVNVLDLILVRNSLGRDPASSTEAGKADVNADGAVNVEDLLVVRGRLGK